MIFSVPAGGYGGMYGSRGGGYGVCMGAPPIIATIFGDTYLPRFLSKLFQNRAQYAQYFPEFQISHKQG